MGTEGLEDAPARRASELIGRVEAGPPRQGTYTGVLRLLGWNSLILIGGYLTLMGVLAAVGGGMFALFE